MFSGQPQIADPQSMIFSPPFLVLALLDGAPSLRAVDATLLAMVFLGGAALMLWFRDQGWHWAGGLIAALAFCYGASMAWRIQHFGQVLSLAYLPIALLCLDRALARALDRSTASRPAWLPPASCSVATRWRCSPSTCWPPSRSGACCGSDEPRAALRASLLPLAAGAACALC